MPKKLVLFVLAIFALQSQALEKIPHLVVNFNKCGARIKTLEIPKFLAQQIDKKELLLLVRHNTNDIKLFPPSEDNFWDLIASNIRTRANQLNNSGQMSTKIIVDLCKKFSLCSGDADECPKMFQYGFEEEDFISIILKTENYNLYKNLFLPEISGTS